jgi:hypothetical protein
MDHCAIVRVGLRVGGIVVAAALIVLAVTALASISGVPRVAERALEHDWCRPSSYAEARRAAALAHARLGPSARRNLNEGASMALAHPAGCRLAVALTRARPVRTPAHPAWNIGRAFASCPRAPLALTGVWRRQAAAAALAVESRSERPIVIRVGLGSASSFGRAQQLQQACGRVAAARSAIVNLSLTAFYPSASVSERVWAVARFADGWHAYFELH